MAQILRPAAYNVAFARENPDSYIRFFGNKRIHELNKHEQKELLRLAFVHDTITLDKQDK